MELPLSTASGEALDTELAIVLEGVSVKWQMNVLQIRGCLMRVNVIVDGYGSVNTPQSRSRRTAGTSSNF
jgi:hypothetical protein